MEKVNELNKTLLKWSD